MALVDTDTGEVMPTENAQPSLIAMSDEELKRAGRRMARFVGELAALKDANADARKDMKAEEEKLEKKIAEIAASIIRQGGGK